MFEGISVRQLSERETYVMFKRLADFICGWRNLTFPYTERSRIFDLMYRNCIPFTDERECDNDTITVRLHEKDSILFQKSANDIGTEYSLGALHGMPVVLSVLCKRPALVLGALLFAGWMFYSTGIVWDIRIEGAEKTDVSKITELLETLDFGIGTYFPATDFNALHAKYAAAQQDIAWLSVYMNGTIAEVQVRELWEDERVKPQKNVYANVVATEDGVVEEITAFEGQPCVKPGDVVRKGQLLISGVILHKDESVRYEYATGEVVCRTAYPICVEIKTKQEKKSYTGREKTKKRIKFFKKTINLFINSGTLYPNYDKIYTTEQLCPFGLCELPIWYEKTVYREYETICRDVSADDAAEEAMTALTAQIEAATREAELLSKRVETSFTDDGVYRVDCLLYLRHDIGQIEEFSISESFVDEVEKTNLSMNSQIITE